MMNDRQTALNAEWAEKHLAPKVRNLTRNGAEWLMSSPLRPDRHPSFSVSLEKGAYNDLATHERGTLTHLAEQIGVPTPEYAGRRNTAANEKRAQERAEKENQSRIDAAKIEAVRAIWEAAVPDLGEHRYIAEKGLAGLPLDVRRLNSGVFKYPKENGFSEVRGAGQLAVPMYDVRTHELVGVELIDNAKGRRRPDKYAKEQYRAKSENFPAVWQAGTCSDKSAPFVLCEGMATAASVKQITGENARVLCCFSSENVPTVGRVIAKKFPGVRIIIATDADKAGEQAYLELLHGKRKENNGRILQAYEHEPVHGVLEVRPPVYESDEEGEEQNSMIDFRAAQGAQAIDMAFQSLIVKKKEECKDDWNDFLLREGLQAAREAFARRLQAAQIIQNYLHATDESDEYRVFDMADETDRDRGERYFAVDDIFPQGLSVLISQSKSGKSWFCLQACAAVAEGVPFLGHKTTHGKVLYVDFEDDRLEVNKRWHLIRGKVSPGQFMYKNDFPRLDAHGLTVLTNIVLEKNISMVVFDMWPHVKPIIDEKKVGNAYEIDTAIARPIKKLADYLGIALVVLVHTSKAAQDNTPLAIAANGTSGLAGAADALARIKPPAGGYRVKGAKALFEKVGRRVRADEFAIIWNAPGFRQMTEEEAAKSEAATMNQTDAAIIEALNDNAAPMSTAEIVKKIKKTFAENKQKISDSGIKNRLSRLLDEGQLERLGRGLYWFPTVFDGTIGGTDKNNLSHENNFLVSNVSSVTNVSNVSNVSNDESHTLDTGKCLRSVEQVTNANACNNCNRDTQNELRHIRHESHTYLTLDENSLLREYDNRKKAPPISGTVSESLFHLAARAGMTVQQLRACAEEQNNSTKEADQFIAGRISFEGDALIVAPLETTEDVTPVEAPDTGITSEIPDSSIAGDLPVGSEMTL